MNDLEQLKAAAYDLYISIQGQQAQLNQVNQAIINLESKTPASGVGGTVNPPTTPVKPVSPPVAKPKK